MEDAEIIKLKKSSMKQENDGQVGERKERVQDFPPLG